MLATVAAAMLLAASVAAPPEPSLHAELAGRRDAIREAIGGDGVAVVFAAAASSSFRQEPDFLYLTGLTEAGAALLLDGAGRRRSETLYLEPRDRQRERWDGPRLGPGGVDATSGEPDGERRDALDRTGIGAVRPRARFARELAAAIRRGRELWIAMPSTSLDEELGPELRLLRDLRDRSPGLVVHDLRPLLRDLRVIKSKAELAAMRRAIEITLEAHREIAREVRPGRHEYEIKAHLEWVFARNGARRPAFPSIVGSGPNATVLHYEDDRRQLEPPDLVVVDIGAEWQGYAADVTRTYPADGSFSKRQREIYDLVRRAQRAAIAAVRPGARLRGDVHRAAREVIAEAGHRAHFLHSTSHYVGLDVHDVGERDGELRAGMVITVEPGVYLEEEGLGVRIEDMVLVTADGAEVLTRSLPSEAEAIERMMRAEGDRRRRQR